MWWENKLMRTFRCRLKQQTGVLGNLLASIGDAKGFLGEIKTIQMGSASVVRDIVVFADNMGHMEKLIKVVQEEPNAELIEVRDEVLEMHQGGKISVESRYQITTLSELRRVYTPGVAEVCLKIQKNPSLVRRFTSIKNLVAIVSDGTAVLGLGDIGAQASMPVMEGKAALMRALSGLYGVPILVDSKDPDTIVDTIACISPTFSAIQLEDISAPRCFEIEDKLKERLDIPVMHDDQHGTAVVVMAGLINAAKMADVSLKKCSIGVIGLGAAGLAISKMIMHHYGKKTMGADISSDARDRLQNEGGIPSDLEEIMAQCDVIIATTGVPGLIKPEMVRDGQIIFALSNPNPEIEPEEAKKAGAIFAADGKSVNNILGFPGIFRGAVDANVPNITQEMLIAAAEAIAEMASPGEMVPSPLNKEVHKNVARAVVLTAIKQGMNREDLSNYFDE
ncbi:NAD-dependent malic enzyme [Acidobacteriota bacterium]